MKAKIILLFTVFLLTCSSIALAEKKTSFSNRWPFEAAKAIAVNQDYVFLGMGNIIRVYEKNTLAIHQDIAIETSEGITGLYYDSGTASLFVTSGHSGLFRIDTNNLGSTPANYIVTGSAYSDSDNLIVPTTRGVSFSNGNAYVAYTKIIPSSNAISGIEIVRASDSGDMSRMGAADVPGGFVTFTDARSIAVSGENAYVADMINGMMRFDISDPSTPQGSYWAVTLTGLDLTINGNYAYVAGGGYGLWIADLTNASWPVKPFAYNGDATYARSLQIEGNYAYVADGNDGGLKIITVSDKANPQVSGTYNSGITGAYSVCAEDSAAYMVDHGTGLTKINAASPAAPDLLASQTDTPANCNKFYLHASSTGDTSLYAYTLESTGINNGMRILKFSQVGSVIDSEFSNIHMQSFMTLPGEAMDVFITEVNENGLYHVYAFIADGNNGLLIYNVDDKELNSRSTLNSDTLSGAGLDQAQAISSADTSNTFIFIADGTNGVRSVRVSNKTTPIIESTVDTPGTAKGIVHSGNYIYVADGSAGLQIIDTSTPTSLRIIGSVDTPGDAKAVDVRNNYAYIADGTSGVQIIDISNPAAPAIVSNFATTDACKIWVNKPEGSLNPNQKTYAYIADGVGGVSVIDVSNSSYPYSVSGWSYNTVGNATDISVNTYGSRAVVADGKGGLSILSFSDIQPGDMSNEDPELDDSCFITTLW